MQLITALGEGLRAGEWTCTAMVAELCKAHRASVGIRGRFGAERDFDTSLRKFGLMSLEKAPGRSLPVPKASPRELDRNFGQGPDGTGKGGMVLIHFNHRGQG